MTLTARDLVLEVGGTVLLDGVHLQVHPGEVIGLVGRNGAGKTSLLRTLAGAAEARAGSVRRPAATGYLSQDPRADAVAPDTRCSTHVLSGRGLDVAADELEKLEVALTEDPSDQAILAFTEARERFERLGGYEADGEVHRLVTGLGLGEDRLSIALGALSGGERRRVELARILFAGSELLLLDEPTNHLDADARDWLLDFLRTFPGGLVVISHDLDLLDEAITRVWHLDRSAEDVTGTLVEYKGTYSQYLRARAEDEERLGLLADRQSKEIARLRRRADSMRGQTAKRARTAKSLDARARRIAATRVEAPRRKRTIDVRLPEPAPVGRTVLEVRELWKSYGHVDVFEDVSFGLGRGERMLIMGLNGAGKTSLLKIVAGRLDADLGEVELDRRARPGYFAQEHEGIVAGRSVLEHLRAVCPLADEALRAVLGMFGLHGDKAFQDAASLSGGEKTKLALAQLVASQHNLLLLDEPTNNLDPEARAAVGTALAGWGGTLVIVSHDREFVRALAPDRVLVMPEGTFDYFADDLLDLVELA